MFYYYIIMGGVTNLNTNELIDKIKINKIVGNKNVESSKHSHPYYELVYVRNANFNYFIEDKLYNITNKSIVLIKKNTIHKAIFRDKTNSTYFVVKFYESCIHRSILDKCLRLFEYKNFKVDNNSQYIIDILFSKICHEYENKEENWQEMNEIQLNELIVALYRLSLNSKPDIFPFVSEIKIILEYINKNVSAPVSELSLNTISAMYFSTPYQLSRLFKKQVGIGFKDYVIQSKISQAKMLIDSGNISLTDIAFECGFNDSNYFSTVFKKVEGISPSTYKKMLKATLS